MLFEISPESLCSYTVRDISLCDLISSILKFSEHKSDIQDKRIGNQFFEEPSDYEHLRLSA